MPQPVDPRKVAIYIRWSTEDQSEGTTLEFQREACEHYLRSQGWEVSPHLMFVDDGYSGGTLRRPALTELRQQVKAGRIDCVVVFKLDRLSRSVVDTVNLVLDEWEGLTHLKSARDPIDTTTPTGKVFFYLLASYAEWERNVIKERTMAGKVRRAKEGRNPGIRIPYGYRSKGGGELEIVPAEADLVRRIFREYLHDVSARRIAIRLNDEGIPSPSGKMWTPQTITDMLGNPWYIGDMVWNRVSINPRRQKDPSEPWVVANANPIVVKDSPYVPAIVDPALFAAVQEHRAGRRPNQTSGRALGSDHLLTGILRCRCGSAMGGAVRRRQTKEYRYYFCLARRDRGGKVCDCGQVPQELVHRALELQLRQRFGDPKLEERYLRMLDESTNAKAATVQQQLAELAAEARRLEEHSKRLNRDYRSGVLSPKLYEENKRELEEEVSELAVRQQRLETQAVAASARDEQRAAFKRVVALARAWNEVGIRERKSALRQLLVYAVAYRQAGDQDLYCEFLWQFEERPDKMNQAGLAVTMTAQPGDYFPQHVYSFGPVPRTRG